MQTKLLVPTTWQVPPFWQGALEHGFPLIWQYVPLNPAAILTTKKQSQQRYSEHGVNSAESYASRRKCTFHRCWDCTSRYSSTDSSCMQQLGFDTTCRSIQKYTNKNTSLCQWLCKWRHFGKGSGSRRFRFDNLFPRIRLEHEIKRSIFYSKKKELKLSAYMDRCRCIQWMWSHRCRHWGKESYCRIPRLVNW